MKHWFIILCIIHFAIFATDKWIVVTTINYPTEQLKKLAAMEDWQLLVVADKKTPVDWHLKNSICLTIEMQKNLPYKIIPLLSFNHYSRKNIGYLYAIAHGAKIIYETDDDNEYIYNNIEFMPATMQIDCCSGATNVTNIYSYFGQKDVWPRGFPLSCVMHCDMPNLTKKITQIPIQQGLVNHDPDVDAIYRLTHNRPIYFSDRSPIALDKAVFCPFNSQNTIFHYNAFWGLLLPISVSMRITDIWRSYWVQRIMWEHNLFLCFTKPSAIQYRNMHNLLDDFAQEQDLYLKTESLIDCLYNWRPNNTNLFRQMLEIMLMLQERHFVQQSDVALVTAWIEDLINIGYDDTLSH